MSECAGPELRHELLGAVLHRRYGRRGLRPVDGHGRCRRGRLGPLGDRGATWSTVTGPTSSRSSPPSTAVSACSSCPRHRSTTTRSTVFDGSFHLAEVGLDGVEVPAARAVVGPDVADGVARATDEAVMGMAATMVGASQRVLELVLDHVKSRHQFGVPIGSFQAVKHMAVDMYVAIERARALCQFAALTIAEDDDRRSPGRLDGEGRRR